MLELRIRQNLISTYVRMLEYRLDKFNLVTLLRLFVAGTSALLVGQLIDCLYMDKLHGPWS